MVQSNDGVAPVLQQCDVVMVQLQVSDHQPAEPLQGTT